VGVLPVVGSGDGAGDVGTVSVTTGGEVTGEGVTGEGVSTTSAGVGQNSSYTSMVLEPFPDLLPPDDPLLDLPAHSAHTDSVEGSLLPDFDPLLPDFPEPKDIFSLNKPLFPDLEPEPLLPLLP